MFLRLLIESFRRQKRRKALAGAAILLGTTAVTAMLALATTIGDRIHRELAVYGANIVITPKAADLAVNLGGVDIHPATGGAYLHESDLEKLKTIFWHNNITGISPELDWRGDFSHQPNFRLFAPIPFPGHKSYNPYAHKPLQTNEEIATTPVLVRGFWFNHRFGNLNTGAPQLHSSWTLDGEWPTFGPGTHDVVKAVVGHGLAVKLHLKKGDLFSIMIPSFYQAPLTNQFVVTGIVNSGDVAIDTAFLAPIEFVQMLTASDDPISRVEISARTRPEDAFARKDPDTLSPSQRDLWYCRPYANSIAYQIREAIPGADAQQVRRVEQSEGTVLSRISGLMWLVSAAALLAAGFAVSAAMATAVLERRAEIGLMRSLGAGRTAIAALFYTESAILATAAGLLGYLAGSALAWGLGRHIFPADGASALFNPVLLPVILALAIVVAILGSTPAIRSGLHAEVSNVLRGNQ